MVILDTSQKALNYTMKPVGYWTTEKGKNMRELFIKIAHERGFDPLLPHNWYSIPSSSLKEVKVFSFFFISKFIFNQLIIKNVFLKRE